VDNQLDERLVAEVVEKVRGVTQDTLVLCGACLVEVDDNPGADRHEGLTSISQVAVVRR